MRFLLIILLFPLLAFAQVYTFQMEYSSIPAEAEGYDIPVPWTGGYTCSSPDFCDIDGDNDFDLFVGYSYKYVAYYNNSGSANSPVFSTVEEQFAGLDNGEGLYTRPEFWDMDSDGDFDLFLANQNEVYITVYENVGSNQSYEFEKVTDTLFTTFGELIYCIRVALWDVDLDGDKDLFCGEHTGEIWQYENVGDSLQSAFRFVTDSFEGIDVGQKSSPCFCDIDADGDLDMFIGNSWGRIYYYRNEGSPGQYNFAEPEYPWLGIDIGDQATPEFCDIDDDGDYDLFLGKENDPSTSPPGTVHFWRNDGNVQNPDFVEVTQCYLTLDAGFGTYPCFCDADCDGDQDLFLMTNDYISAWVNVGTQEDPAFSLQTWDLIGGLPPGNFDFGDLDGDGDPDMITSAGWTGVLKMWENVSSGGTIQFIYAGHMDLVYYLIYRHTLGDLDGDGDVDMLLGGAEFPNPNDGFLCYFENVGGPQWPEFVLVTAHWDSIEWHTDPIPTLCDVDLDGDLDLWMEEYSTPEVWFYENQGTPTNPDMELITTTFLNHEFYELVTIDGCDIDADNDVDVFLGGYSGGCRFLRNVTGELAGPKRPIGPPIRGSDVSLVYNPITGITFNLPATQNITLAVYNLLGRKVTTIVSGRQPAGTHSFCWNPSQHASGVYIIRLETPQYTSSQRVMVIK